MLRCVFLNCVDLALARNISFLYAQRHEALALGFASPLRDGIRGTFFEGDPLIDLEPNPTDELYKGKTVAEYESAYGSFLASFFNSPLVLAELLIRKIETDAVLGFYESVIIEDARDKSLVGFVADYVGRTNCLIANIGAAPKLHSKTIPIIDLLAPDLSVEAIVTALAPHPLPHSKGPRPNV